MKALIPHASTSELFRRVSSLKERLSDMGCDVAYITNPSSIFYLTNLSLIQTERPLALILPVDGEAELVAPSVEKGHIEHRNAAWGGVVKSVTYYFDYPGERSVMEMVAEILTSRLKARCVAGDSQLGAQPLYGYRGPPLSDMLKSRGVRWVDLGDVIYELRLHKSDEEISLIQESGRWAARSLQVALELIRPGRWDWEIMLEASELVLREMNSFYNPYTPLKEPVGPIVGFRGQVGEFSAYPHALVSERPIREGDVIGVGAGPEIGGYYAELERTLVVGSPRDDVRKAFKVMLELREAAIRSLEPGVEASLVDAAVREEAKRLGVVDLLRHHTGHGIGIEIHEPPYLDIGYKVRLEPGMVFTVEPGIYIPGLGGFRHSDTFVMTKEGPKQLTQFPVELEELTVRG
ncbi:MAG: M24 family metallopeptidase [Acidilobus sp.]